MFGFDWDAPLPDEERDSIIDRTARLVVTRGLQAPAILFLEMHKPLAGLACQTVIFSAPVVIPFFGPQNVQKFARLIEKRENVELLIRQIENYSESLPDPLNTPRPATKEMEN